jgi:hypothetical protein
MNDKEALHGLACPRCGGMVPIPEGQEVVVCPFCSLSSVVGGDRGIRRYQVPQRVDKNQATQAYQKFLSSNMAIAPGTGRNAQLDEVLLVHLPFWVAWGRGLGWIFGRKEVGSGDNRHYEPREVRVAHDLSWNNAACDVGEFGVSRISLEGRPLEPFNAENLHRSGLVFEPVGSDEEALESARTDFEQRIRSEAHLDQISQSFVRILRPRLGVVTYPLWVLRYLYKGRSFQVVVDGYTGEVLYGKAPGNVYYRSAILVGGMALGAFLSIDIAGLIASGKNSSGSGALIFFGIGLGIMYAAYRAFRYGEHYEYRRFKAPAASVIVGNIQIPDAARQAVQILSQIERFRD